MHHNVWEKSKIQRIEVVICLRSWGDKFQCDTTESHINCIILYRLISLFPCFYELKSAKQRRKARTILDFFARMKYLLLVFKILENSLRSSFRHSNRMKDSTKQFSMHVLFSFAIVVCLCEMHFLIFILYLRPRDWHSIFLLLLSSPWCLQSKLSTVVSNHRCGRWNLIHLK